MQNIKTFLAHLSQLPGVYQMLNDKREVIYVGKAKNLKKRVSSYFSQRAQDSKTRALVQQIADIDITVTSNENEAILLECNLIKKHRPRYNILLRDDKSYPYITISKGHQFPRIDFYRGAKKKHVEYFGPFPSSSAVRETISLLQKIFKLRTCQDSYFAGRSRPCLLHQIDRCTAPCVGLISSADYAENLQLAKLFLLGKSDEVINRMQERMESAALALQFETASLYRDQINRLRRIQGKQYMNTQDGNADVIGWASQAGIICLQLIVIRGGQVLGSRSYFPKAPEEADGNDVLRAFIMQHYLGHLSQKDNIPKQIIIPLALEDHEALTAVLSSESGRKVELLHNVRSERKKWIEMAMASALQSLSAQITNKANMRERFKSLQALLGLEKLPERIECFDISHSMGEATVASCVVFNCEGPYKSGYRRFNINDITPGDDYAAMRQALLRRFKRLQREQQNYPDILIIDGGAQQLAVAAQVFTELEIKAVEVKLIGIAKGPDRKAGFETLHQINKEPIHLASDALALHLLQHIRDEAHRFAITGHRQRRDKARQQSILLTVPGIGATRRRELLRYFGGIQGLARASLDELTKVPGINRALAERIFAILHDANT